MAELITIQRLRDFLGVDENSDADIKDMMASALEDLERSTGVDWTKQEKLALVNEYIQCSVFLAFYGNRDGAQNLQYIAERRHKITKKLQYADEVGEEDDVP